MTSSLQTQNA